MHILDNPHIWQLFREFNEHVFGQYSKAMATIRSFGISDQMSVLDVGSGIGQYSELTKGRYLGIDMNKEYINQAKQIYIDNPSINFLCEDLGKAELSEAAFDVSLLIDFTHHLSTEELNRVFFELNRVTSQYIVICDPVKQSAKNLLGRLLTYLDRGEYIRSEAELITLISNHFEILKVKKSRGLMSIEGVFVLAKPIIK